MGDYKDQSELRLEGDLAAECIKKYQVGDMVEIMVYGKITRMEERVKPEYGPSMAVTVDVMKKETKDKTSHIGKDLTVDYRPRGRRAKMDG